MSSRSRVHQNDWAEICTLFEAWESSIPGGDEEFDRFELPGAAEGDWPVWPQQVMLRRVPADILRAFGAPTRSVLNGDFAQIPEDELGIRALSV